MKNKIKIITFICCFVFYTNNIFSQITRDSAYSIVKNEILGENWQNYDIFVSPNLVSPNTNFILQNQNITSPSINTWFFFVDIDPNRGWPHECKYVFINATNGGGTSFNASEYPDNLGSMIHINYAVVCNKSLSVNNAHGRSYPHCINDHDSCNMYAIIINTATDTNSIGGRAHWNDCSELYKMLCNDFNYPKSHIYTFMPKSVSWDLDRDGVNDVNYVASKNDIEQGFNNFATNHSGLGSESTVLVYVAGNGGYFGTEHQFYDTTMSTYWDSTSFASVIDTLQMRIKSPLNIVLQFYWSGAFLQALSTADYGPRVITSSSSPHTIDLSDVTTISTSNPIYYWFTYTWLSSILGYDLKNPNQPTYADSNYDGFISMQEAYWYALEQSVNANTCIQNANHPMYWSSQNPSYGDMQTLCGRVKYDLFIKDDPNDFGFEPNGSANTIDNSPDIWVRHNSDGIETHQLPFKNNRNYIYVRVRNIGSEVSIGDSLFIYIKPKPTNYGVCQQKVVSVPIPRLSINTDTLFCFSVTFTTSAIYNNCDYSILSVIKSANDTLYSPLNLPATSNDILNFVRRNNNVAMRNTAVADAIGGGGGSSLILLSPNPNSGNEINIQYVIDKKVTDAKLLIYSATSMAEKANYSLNLNTTTKQINISNYRQGTYIIVLVCDGVVLDSKIFVKQ